MPVAARWKRAQPLRAVFLNYLLDCLPAAVLELDGEAVRQLCVRTCVARNVRLADYTDLTAEQLRQRGGACPLSPTPPTPLPRRGEGERGDPQPLSPGGERGDSEHCRAA